jgi:hypothetical protein
MNKYVFKGKPPIATKAGIPVADSFIRIVHGGRGAYVEFDSVKNVFVPEKEQWRHRSDKAFYEEYRTFDGVKVYHQRKPVDYADYQVGKWYISPVYLADFETDGTYERQNSNT